MMQMSGFLLKLGSCLVEPWFPWLVNYAAGEQLKLESSQLLSDWVSNVSRHLGQGSDRSQIAQHPRTRAKRNVLIHNISYKAVSEDVIRAGVAKLP